MADESVKPWRKHAGKLTAGGSVASLALIGWVSSQVKDVRTELTSAHDKDVLALQVQMIEDKRETNERLARIETKQDKTNELLIRMRREARQAEVESDDVASRASDRKGGG